MKMFRLQSLKATRAWCETTPVCSGLTRLVRAEYAHHYSGTSGERARITRRAQDGSVQLLSRTVSFNINHAKSTWSQRMQCENQKTCHQELQIYCENVHTIWCTCACICYNSFSVMRSKICHSMFLQFPSETFIFKKMIKKLGVRRAEVMKACWLLIYILFRNQLMCSSANQFIWSPLQTQFALVARLD